MKRNILLLILVVIGISSCSDSEPQLLNGIITGHFVEITSENNRMTLIFSSNSNQLQEKRIFDRDNPSGRTYSIRI